MQYSNVISWKFYMIIWFICELSAYINNINNVCLDAISDGKLYSNIYYSYYNEILLISCQSQESRSSFLMVNFRCLPFPFHYDILFAWWVAKNFMLLWSAHFRVQSHPKVWSSGSIPFCASTLFASLLIFSIHHTHIFISLSDILFNFSMTNYAG
jgi:hypothetical protein